MVTKEDAQRRQFFKKLLIALRPPSFEGAYRHGTFAACEAVKPSQGFNLKSLHVEGVGELPLPLSVEDTSKLRSVCEQAPFGKGSATKVDTSVRRCWQVDASKLTFPGSPTSLSEFIQPLANEAVRALGLDGAGVQVEAHLYKLLLYEEGGHFAFHRDTEKEKGMFASLILQLPTEEGYTGGKLVVKHNSKKKKFDCHMASTLGFCYTVFFADCLHELREIESGTRLCLAFNLVKRDSPLDSMVKGFTPEKLQRVEAALEPWWEEARTGKANVLGGKLAIPLLHQDTEANLSFAGLKGEDRTVAEVSKECGDKSQMLQQQLDLHLCLVTKHKSQDAYPDGSPMEDGEVKVDFEFHNWIGSNGRKLAFRGVSVDMKKDLVVGEEEDAFDSEPDEDDCEYTGNEGATLKYWYHTALLVAWPKAPSV